MSEYQYYEFQAVDSLLTRRDQEELREVSTRAQITSSRFFNEYHFGSFKGNTSQMMEKYFDGFLYFANWGTRELIFRFPLGTVDISIIKQYQTERTLKVWTTDRYVVVRFYFHEDDSWDSEEWCAEGDGSLSEFLLLRASVLDSFDYRVFYLGWLLGVQSREVSLDSYEPPMPQGLKNLTEELRMFQHFFKIDDALVAAAAENSTSEIEYVYADAYESSISALGQGRKNDWLCQLLEGYDKHLSARFRLQIYKDAQIDVFCDKKSRTVSEIIAPLKAA